MLSWPSVDAWFLAISDSFLKLIARCEIFHFGMTSSGGMVGQCAPVNVLLFFVR